MTARTRIETTLVDGKVLSTTSSTELSRHEHDCDSCLFMGLFGEYDLYFCPGSKSLIARHGIEGEYTSQSIGTFISFKNCNMTNKDDPLSECFDRLVDMGIY